MYLVTCSPQLLVLLLAWLSAAAAAATAATPVLMLLLLLLLQLKTAHSNKLALIFIKNTYSEHIKQATLLLLCISNDILCINL